MLQEARLPPLDLGPRERLHLECFHPAGQTVSDPWEGQHIGRAREQKTAWAIIFIDRLLDRQEQAGRALNLVDDSPFQAPNEFAGSDLAASNCLIVEPI